MKRAPIIQSPAAGLAEGFVVAGESYGSSKGGGGLSMRNAPQGLSIPDSSGGDA